jgi:hypothetical protein
MKWNRIKMFIPLIFVSVWLLGSCATAVIDIVPMTDQVQKLDTLILKEIHLDSVYSYTDAMDILRSIIISSGKKEGFRVLDQSGSEEPRNSISFTLREKSYIRGFKSLRSLAIIAEITDSEGKVVYHVAHFFDGDKSFDSIGYVREAMDGIFRELRKALTKNNESVEDTQL